MDAHLRMCNTVDNRAPARAAQRGGIAIMSALIIPLMLGFAALVVDLGRMYVSRSELQNAMDACALAAVVPLTGQNDPNIFNVANAYGRAVLDPTVASPSGARPTTSVNKVRFQAQTLDLSRLVIEYSSALSGQPWAAVTSTTWAGSGVTPATARFVRCSYNDQGLGLLLRPVLAVFGAAGANTVDVRAHAVAQLSNSALSCLMPVVMCKQPGSTASSSPPWGLAVGSVWKVVSGGGAPTYAGGEFGWVDFTTGGGASELEQGIAGDGVCGVGVGSVGGSTGLMASLYDPWNSRFGLYKGGPAINRETSPPDYTGKGFPDDVPSRYPEFVAARAARTIYNASFPGGGAGGYSRETNLTTYGQSRRVVTTAIMDCSAFGPGTGAPVVDFACVYMRAPGRPGGGGSAFFSEFSTDSLKVEYLGLASAPGSPCGTSGSVGGTGGPLVPALAQ